MIMLYDEHSYVVLAIDEPDTTVEAPGNVMVSSSSSYRELLRYCNWDTLLGIIVIGWAGFIAWLSFR